MAHMQATKHTASTMLSELQRAHAAVRSCIREMDVVTSASSPDRLKYTQARFRISRASMGRRACCTAVCRFVLENASVEEKAVIAGVKEADRLLLHKSACHVSRWTPDAIAANWRSYCAASRQIRRDMLAELDVEADLLFPLLSSRSGELSNAPHRRRAA
jgi:hypothetical protein